MLPEIAVRTSNFPKESFLMDVGDPASFDVGLQMRKLHQSNGSVELWLEETRDEVIAHAQEYSFQSPILPYHDIAIREIGGHLEVTCKGEPLLSAVNSNEREGVVKEVVGRVVDFLVEASPGSMAVMTSPMGWTNLYFSDGEPRVFREGQTYVFLKSDCGLRAFTLRTDFDLSQNEALMRFFNGQSGGRGLYWEAKERIKEVVSNVALLEPISGRPREINEVLEAMVQVRGSDLLWKENSVGLYRRLIANPNFLAQWEEEEGSIGQVVNRLIDEFEEYVLDACELPDSYHLIRDHLKKTVLAVSRAVRRLGPFSGSVDFESQRGRLTMLMTERDYHDEIAYLNRASGCRGQARVAGQLFSVQSESSAEEAVEDGFCPICGFRLDSSGYCPICGQTFTMKAD